MDKHVKGLVTTILFFILSMSLCYGEMYKWVDEKGTLHFADDLSKVPEKYRPDAEMRKAPKEMKEVSVPEAQGKPKADPGITSAPGKNEAEGYEVNLFRRHELWLTEVVLNGSAKYYFIVDTGEQARAEVAVRWGKRKVAENTSTAFDTLAVGTRFRWQSPRWWRGYLMNDEYVKGHGDCFGPPDNPEIWEAGSSGHDPIILASHRLS